MIYFVLDKGSNWRFKKKTNKTNHKFMFHISRSHLLAAASPSFYMKYEKKVSIGLKNSFFGSLYEYFRVYTL